MGQASRYKKRMTNRQKARHEALNGLDDNDQRNRSADWVIDINSFLDEGASYDTGKSWTIYRIPANLMEVQRKAYVPKIVSIGPFYYRDPRFTMMDKVHKRRYLLRLLGIVQGGALTEPEVGVGSANSGQSNGEAVVKDEYEIVSRATSDEKRDWRIKPEALESAMRKMEQRTRDRYSEDDFDLISSDDFVQMMVLDGCFIVELLRLYYKHDNKVDPVDDPIFTTRWMLRTLQRDLLMLENQLPLFVLQELFELSRLDPNEPPLTELILRFLDPLFPREQASLNLSFSKSDESYDHILDVFHSSFIAKLRLLRSRSANLKAKNTPLTAERQLLHSVMELQEVGVEFKVAHKRELLDINFTEGVLEIPPLYIDDNTVPVLLNFLAFEQCDLEAEPFFTDFFIFFDSLINSPKDVAVLHTNGIINHLLGSDKDVANLFNRVAREIVFDGIEQSYLSPQTDAVNKYFTHYYETRWHSWWTHLIRDYFSSPWTVLSLLAAVVLLILTLLQTFYTMLAYHLPPK